MSDLSGSASNLSYTISTEGLEEEILKLGKLPENLTEELKKAVKIGNQAIKNDMVPRVRRFTGSTARSITSKVKVGVGGSVMGITGPSMSGKNARVHIFRFLQDGAYWQNSDNSQPWIYDLLDWVRAKFHPAPEDEKRAAFALARSIKEKGIKGEPISRPVLEAKKGYAVMVIKAAIDSVLEKLKV
ncbi:MAG: HK97 gp10 family phage protein [Pelolinea sp.]|nr:HK97 gp10 family phage protein [Pelolinea sp.]